MSVNGKFVKKLNDRFAKKQNELTRIPAEMGNGYGGLEVEGVDSFIYVQINGKSTPIFNNRVANQIGTKVWVGYSAEEPLLFQVLSTRSDAPTGSQTGYVGYAPARRYEWHAVHGGQDPLYVHQRALTHLRLSVCDTVPTPGQLLVNLYRGNVYNGIRYYQIARQDLDIAEHVPVAIDKAAFVLITINSSGAVVQTKGDEVDIDDLAVTDIPDIPENSIFVCGAVRVYYGQVKVLEGRTNTDFVDLRLTSSFAFSSPADPTISAIESGQLIEYIEIDRWSALEGEDTFDFSDFVQDVVSIKVNGVGQDPLTYSLSDNRDQLVLDTPLEFDAIVTSEHKVEVL